MRALWVDAGKEADYVKAKRESMTALYFAVSDPIQDTNRRVLDAKAKGYAPGVYMAWNWPEYANLSGLLMAEKVNGYVSQLSVPVKVQFDIEKHDPGLILSCLQRWRQLQPKTDTSWTMEGHQGGWMLSDFVKVVVQLKVRVVPQCYEFDMSRLWDTLEMARDLTKRGFPDSLVSPFHDAARLPAWWQGFAFIQHRLP